jgi:Tfp pilus assembly protein FimT
MIALSIDNNTLLGLLCVVAIIAIVFVIVRK